MAGRTGGEEANDGTKCAVGILFNLPTGEEVFPQVSEVREWAKEYSKAPSAQLMIQLAFKLHLRVLHSPPIAPHSTAYLYLGAYETK